MGAGHQAGDSDRNWLYSLGSKSSLDPPPSFVYTSLFPFLCDTITISLLPSLSSLQIPPYIHRSLLSFKFLAFSLIIVPYKFIFLHKYKLPSLYATYLCMFLELTLVLENQLVCFSLVKNISPALVILQLLVVVLCKVEIWIFSHPPEHVCYCPCTAHA